MKSRRLALFLTILILLVWADLAIASESSGAVCPPGNVKFEADGGYEYTDDSATITLSDNAMSATWSPEPNCAVSAVCIKIGGPGGGSLVNPDPNTRSWSSDTYAISHVVLTTQCAPNAVGLTGFTAEPLASPAGFDQRYLIVAIIFTAFAVIGVWTVRDLRRKER